MNIFEDTAHPGIGADVLVWYACTAKGAKDIDDSGAKGVHVSLNMLVQVVYGCTELRAKVKIFTQKRVGAASMDEGATCLTRTAQIRQLLFSVALQVAEEVVSIAIIVVQIGLIAKGE